MKRTKVLVLASTYPRWVNDTIPNFVESLCIELIKNNLAVTVLAPHYCGAKKFEKLNGVDVYRFRYAPDKLEVLAYEGGMLNNVKKNFLAKLVLLSFLMIELFCTIYLVVKIKHDVIHAHWVLPQGLVAIFAKKILFWRNTLVLVTAHGGDVFGLKGDILDRIKNWVFKESDRTAAVSKAVAEKITQAKSLCIKSMGVDATNIFVPPDKNTRSHILFVGRLVDKKGCDVLLNAFHLVLKSKPMLKLKIIGSGPEEMALKNLSKSLHIDENVEFIGALSQGKLIKWYQSANIFVMPSVIAKSGDQEGLGLVAAEAMACECPVIASNLSAVRDLIDHNINGILVRPHDESALAEAIIKLIDGPEKASRLGKNGREKVIEKFDWSVIGFDYAKIINCLF